MQTVPANCATGATEANHRCGSILFGCDSAPKEQRGISLKLVPDQKAESHFACIPPLMDTGTVHGLPPPTACCASCWLW